MLTILITSVRLQGKLVPLVSPTLGTIVQKSPLPWPSLRPPTPHRSAGQGGAGPDYIGCPTKRSKDFYSEEMNRCQVQIRYLGDCSCFAISGFFVSVARYAANTASCSAETLVTMLVASAHTEKGTKDGKQGGSLEGRGEERRLVAESIHGTDTRETRTA